MALIDPRVLAALGGQQQITAGAQLPGVVAPGQVRQYVVNQPLGALPAGPQVATPQQFIVPNTGQVDPSLYSRAASAQQAAQTSGGIPVSGGATGGVEYPDALRGMVQQAGNDTLGAGLVDGLAGGGEAAADAAPGLLSRLYNAGPGGVKNVLKDSLPEDATLASTGLGALKAAAGGAIPGLVLDAAGNIIDDGGTGVRHDVGSAVSGAGEGAAIGGGLAAGLASVLPEEAAAGPPGWIAAGVGGAALGGYKLYEALTGNDKSGSKDANHAAYSTGWKKINDYASSLGILNGNYISGVKDAYNLILQGAKDPTDKKTQHSALKQAQSLLDQYATQDQQAANQKNNLLAAQAYGQQTIAPYLAQEDQAANAAGLYYKQLADATTNPQARALALATGAGFQTNAAQNKATLAAQATAAPYEAQQQQALIAQYQQQIQAAAAAKGQTANL